MLSRGGVQKTLSPLSWVLLWAMMAHAVVSIIILIKGRKENKKSESRTYSKDNVSTLVQRVSGILLIVFTVLHVMGTIGVITPPKPVHAIVVPLFFALSLAHVAVSGSKPLISLGVGNAKVIKVVDILIKAICALTLIASVIGFYLYLC